jgi:hypothetical protein
MSLLAFIAQVLLASGNRLSSWSDFADLSHLQELDLGDNQMGTYTEHRLKTNKQSSNQTLIHKLLRLRG